MSCPTGVVRLELVPEVRLERNGVEVPLPAPPTGVAPVLEHLGYLAQMEAFVLDVLHGTTPELGPAFGRAVLDVVSSYSGAYTESGAGAGDLSVNEDWVHALRGGGKLRLSQHFETAVGGSSAVVEPRVTVGLLREVPLGDRSSNARFAAFGGGFAIEGDDRYRTVATAGFGSDMRIGDDTFLFADYEVEFSDDRRAHLFTGGVRVTW